MADSVFLEKARIAQAGAESEYQHGRYINVANRACYACFLAAIAALIDAGIRPAGSSNDWEHAFVQSRFVGQLINRRKLYPSSLRSTLLTTFELRVTADYDDAWVPEDRAIRALRQARRFVAAIEQGAES